MQLLIERWPAFWNLEDGRDEFENSYINGRVTGKGLTAGAADGLAQSGAIEVFAQIH